MYNIDLATLLQLLQEFRRSVSISAQLPSGALSLKEQCQVKIELVEGKIMSCRIENNNGQVRISGDDALQALYRLGTINWKLQEQIETPKRLTEASPTSLLDPSAIIPQRLARVEQITLNRLSRKHRRVFVLIDGERSVAKIASMLSVTLPNTKEVMVILRELEAMRLITLRG